MQLHPFTPWKRLQRDVVYKTPYLRVYNDTVQLPSGQVVDDYSVVEFHDPVLIIATTTDDKVILLQEYRYAVNQTMWNVPAGSMSKDSEDVKAVAARELLEETGYKGSKIDVVDALHEYPTKAMHTVHIVRIKNAVKIANTKYEPTEYARVVIASKQQVKMLVQNGDIKSASIIAAFALAMPELLQ